ncbi:hypothetical protein JL720_8693 [Aureococcus anophagefferens]|nr:hypothetical protein JL720_8693 [Aureococcus anophagefferens]
MQPATWIFGLCVAGAAASQQRATLLELYDATGGSGWANASGWATAAADECAWHGVTCAGGRVVALDLVENGLDGLLPALGGLGALEELLLAENIVGGLPDDAFADAPNLDLLRLASESLAGERLPSAWPAPCVLTTLSVQYSGLVGPLPAALGGCDGLTNLRLSGNHFTGALPDAWRDLASLERLMLSAGSDNATTTRALAGPLDAVASLPALTYVFAKSQRFNGTLPNFGSALRVLNLENNDVDAFADDFRRNMSACETLSLAGNRLATLPESWAEADAVVMPELLVLSLAENAIAGRPGRALRMHRFSRLMVFDLSGNLLTGDLDAAYDSKPPAETLRTAKLARNALTGSLPAPANLPEVITTLDLSDNDLEGAVWSEYANLENLYVAGTRMGDDALPVFLEADRSSKVVDEPSGAAASRRARAWTLLDAGVALDECVCLFGYYSSVANASYVRGSSRHATWGLPGVDCLPCPDGAPCLGYGHAPLTRPNHWAHVDDPTLTAECRPACRCAVNAANCRPSASMIWGTIGVIESDVVCADVGRECAGAGRAARVSSPGYAFGYYNPARAPTSRTCGKYSRRA